MHVYEVYSHFSAFYTMSLAIGSPFQALKPAHVPALKEILPDPGCERPDPCRVAGSGGAGAIQQQVISALASGGKIPFNTLLGQLNTMLSASGAEDRSTVAARQEGLGDGWLGAFGGAAGSG